MRQPCKRRWGLQLQLLLWTTSEWQMLRASEGKNIVAVVKTEANKATGRYVVQAEVQTDAKTIMRVGVKTRTLTGEQNVQLRAIEPMGI